MEKKNDISGSDISGIKIKHGDNIKRDAEAAYFGFNLAFVSGRRLLKNPCSFVNLQKFVVRKIQ